MSVRERIEEAIHLWAAGRKAGACVPLLIAVAATARKRYPRPTKERPGVPHNVRPRAGQHASDNVAFKTFILDEMLTITGGKMKYNVAFPFQGKERVPPEEILYSHLRCPLVHEGEAKAIYLTPAESRDGKIFSVLKLTDPFGFPEEWISNLCHVVVTAPENKEEFKEFIATIDRVRSAELSCQEPSVSTIYSLRYDNAPIEGFSPGKPLTSLTDLS